MVDELVLDLVYFVRDELLQVFEDDLRYLLFLEAQALLQLVDVEVELPCIELILQALFLLLSGHQYGQLLVYI